MRAFVLERKDMPPIRDIGPPLAPESGSVRMKLSSAHGRNAPRMPGFKSGDVWGHGGSF